jgi:hypothetical protein
MRDAHPSAMSTDQQGTAFLATMTAAMAELAEEYDTEAPSELPQRYRDFLETGEYRKYDKHAGEFYSSPHTFKFTDAFLVSHFATSEALDGIVEAFEDDHAHALAMFPLTQLWGGPGKSSSIALFVDLSKPACSVHRLDEGQLRPVAKSLDAFLASLAPTG